MKKSILLAFVALIGVNCGNSAEQDLNEIIESIKKLAPCTGSKYQALGQTQIDEIKKNCTTAELGGLNAYYKCFAEAACSVSIENSVLNAKTACASTWPTFSNQCLNVIRTHTAHSGSD